MIQSTIVAVVITTLIGGGIWALHTYRDYVVAMRDAQYAEAARKKNVTLRQVNSESERVEAVLEALVAAGLEEAKKATGASCPASAEQAQALTKIRKAN